MIRSSISYVVEGDDVGLSLAHYGGDRSIIRLWGADAEVFAVGKGCSVTVGLETLKAMSTAITAAIKCMEDTKE